MKNKRGAIGATMTWVIATVVILFVIILFVLASQALAGSKSMQKIFGLRKEGNIQTASLFGDLLEDILNTRTFLISQTCWTDCVNYFLFIRIPDFFPSWEPCCECFESAIPVDIIRILREDS